MLNTLPTSEARQPRGIVKVNGQRLDGWIEWEVDNNTYYEADSFKVCFALSDLPAEYGDAWWASQQEIFIEIFGGFPANPDKFGTAELQSWIYGRVDDIEFDLVGRKVTAIGRDLTAELIDAKTSETFQNLTSSQIAEMIAKRHNLVPVVTKTAKMSGKYYLMDQTRTMQERSEWDLLTALAGEEQFVVYVKGRELHFEPQPSPNAEPYVLKWEPPTQENGVYVFNGKSIKPTRSLTLARGVVVTVLSISPKTGEYVKVTYPKKPANVKTGQSTARAQQYTFKFANLTYEKALQKAQELHRDITAHEVKLEATLPADNVLQTTNMIKLIGTDTAFDQTYYPESIRREMSNSGGYAMTVHAKNHSPQSIVPL